MTDEEVIKQWTPLVYKRAFKYSKVSYLGVDDLVSIGQWAALNAYKSFDSSKAASLMTHIYNHVTFEMLNAVNDAHPIKRSQKNRIIAVERAFKALGEDATPEQISEFTKKNYKNRGSHLTPTTVQEILNLRNISQVSYNAILELPGNAKDKILPHVIDTTEEDVNNSLQKQRLLRELDTLKPKQKRVVELRLKDMTYDEIGKDIGVTRERVRQILNEATRILQRRLK